MNPLTLIKNFGPVVVIGLICLALWMLNARSSQLEATNQRLEQLANSKDDQINDLRSKNDGLASSVSELVTAVNKQSAVVSEAIKQRAETAQQNRNLQIEIKALLASNLCAASAVPGAAVDRLRDAAKAAGGVPDNQPASSSDPH